MFVVGRRAVGGEPDEYQRAQQKMIGLYAVAK